MHIGVPLKISEHRDIFNVKKTSGGKLILRREAQMQIQWNCFSFEKLETVNFLHFAWAEESTAMLKWSHWKS